MFKLLLKLAIVGLLANAAYHLMTAYASYYKFKDAVQQTMQFGNDKSLDRIRARIVELASDYDLPLDQDEFSLRREALHTIVDGSFTRPVELLPGFPKPWTFSFHIDTYSEAPMSER